MRVLLVDDHAIVRAGLRRLLASQPDVQFYEAATGDEALALVRAERPTLIVLDLNLPGMGGLELLQQVLIEQPKARVLVLSMYAEARYATRALRAGALGYLSKNALPDEVLEAFRRVAEGGHYIEAELAQTLALQAARTDDPMARLSERDLQIMYLLSNGQSLSNIAAALGVSSKAVANLCSQIKTKLGVTRIVDLVRLSIECKAGKPT